MENENLRRLSSRDKILKALEAAGEVGATNFQLTAIALRFGARIYELRGLGHFIETIHEKDGQFRFILHKPQPPTQLPLIEGMCAHV